ncbi:hypothetical protein ASE90_05095 [Sphingomonas sp. Leaf67]|nr:hypothetical protein ASE90_05095 [Sphingomonas sp. Leaf67]
MFSDNLVNSIKQIGSECGVIADNYRIFVPYQRETRVRIYRNHAGPRFPERRCRAGQGGQQCC